MENVFFHIRMLLGCLLESSNVVLLELVVTKKKIQVCFQRGKKSAMKRQFPSKSEKNIVQDLILRSLFLTDPTD